MAYVLSILKTTLLLQSEMAYVLSTEAKLLLQSKMTYVLSTEDDIVATTKDGLRAIY